MSWTNSWADGVSIKGGLVVEDYAGLGKGLVYNPSLDKANSLADDIVSYENLKYKYKELKNQLLLPKSSLSYATNYLLQAQTDLGVAYISEESKVKIDNMEHYINTLKNAGEKIEEIRIAIDNKINDLQNNIYTYYESYKVCYADIWHPTEIV